MALPILNVIGQASNLDQHGKRVVLGKLDFAGDRLARQKLYGAVKGSSIAHGNIKLDANKKPMIDVTAALAEPGVKAVVTYLDVPTWSQSITSWGQQVAGVVADNWYTAVRATSLITVTYDVSTVVSDPDVAIQAGSPLSGGLPSSNTSTFSTVTRGDIAAGFQKADVTLSTTQPWSTTYQHNALEQHQAVGWWVGDDVYVWMASQAPHSHKTAIVNNLALDSDKVHFFTHGCGGGFGDRAGVNEDENVVVAVMSQKVNGAPVHLIETKQNHMTMNTRQFETRTSIKLGAMNDGTLVACDAQAWSNLGRKVGYFAADWFGLKNTYTIPNLNALVTAVVTNQPPRGAWRCVGDPPAAFGYDIALDKLATKLNMDPYKLRMKNLRAGDAPAQDTPFRVWGGNGIGLCFDAVHSASSYDSKWHAPATKTLADGTMHGIAITGHLDGHGGISGASRGGIVTMTPAGQAFINMGGGRATSGAPTAMVHIVAEMLGLKYNDVRCGDWGATDTTLDASVQAGSTFTVSAGSAFFNAAMDARNQLFTAVLAKAPFSTITGITINDLSASNSSIYLTSDPSKTITHKAAMSGTPPICGRGVGWGAVLKSKAVGGVPIGSACNVNGACASCAEVAVDTETGVVTILGHWNSVDTGRTIYKDGTLRELNAGSELQVSQALFFGDIYDPTTGACISSQYTESMLPTYMDIKTELNTVKDVESDDSAGPYGCHGIAEPCSSNYSSIICAIYNATGVWVDPEKGACTPNKVLKALGKA